MERKLLLCDTELTSLDSTNNLITVYLGIVDKDEIIDELDLRLIPNDGLFTLDPKSMGINNIDIRNWDGIKYKDARKLLGDFIRKYVYDKGVKVGSKLLPLGHAIGGDIDKIQECIINRDRWCESISHLYIDTLQYAGILRHQGKLDINSISLESLSNYFDFDGNNLHTAKVDAILAWKLYKELIKLS